MLRPSTTSRTFRYPPHNKDYGVEQDFYEFIRKNNIYVTDSLRSADWHYLPVYWTRWHLNHNYAKDGLDELQKAVDKCIINSKKTFTICQYDDGPVVNLGKTLLFLSSRQKKINGTDIPLLCSCHRKPFFGWRKKYLASFVGRLHTYPIRTKMVEKIYKRKDIFIYDGNKGSSFFVRKILESYIALCPRGYGGSSFRFFEAMQLGVVPYLIGDIDTRPFKKFIRWDNISLFSSSSCNLNRTLDSLSKNNLVIMGKQAEKEYQEKLDYQKWCKLVLKELEVLK